MSSDKSTVLDVRSLEVEFATENGPVMPVDDVTFSVLSSEVVGLVGESGCGKSTTASAILRLLDEKHSADISGEVLLGGVDLLQLSEKRMRAQRGSSVAYISQDPLTALNPVHRIGDQIIEAIRVHNRMPRSEAKALALGMLEKVRLPDPATRFNAFPHQLSGGMRQRVVIAMALVMNPSLLIADEPTTALDVTTQAQILELFMALKEEMQASIVLITHDLGVVAQTCDRVLVMYAGQIVEDAPVLDLFESPLHPYSIVLMNATPSLDEKRMLKTSPSGETRKRRREESGAGCRFANRCGFATEICFRREPVLEQVAPGRGVRCWNHEAVLAANAAPADQTTREGAAGGNDREDRA